MKKELSTEKTKFIDLLYSYKEIIVSLLEMLSMEVKDTYGMKKVIDILREMFIMYQEKRCQKNRVFENIMGVFWKWITRIAIIMILVFFALFIVFLLSIWEQLKQGKLPFNFIP